MALGRAPLMIAVDDKLAGAIELQPTVRPEAKEIIIQFQSPFTR